MKSVLLLNLIPNTIGDNVLITPMLSILKNHFKQSHIDLTVSPLNEEIFENNPHLDNLIKIEELVGIADRTMSKVFKLRQYLHIIAKYSKKFQDRYDLCFVMLPNFPLNVLIPKKAHVSTIVGFNYAFHPLSFLLDKKTPYKGIETGHYERHFIENYLDLLRIADIPFSKDQVICKVYVTAKELKKVRYKNYVCFQTGSKGNAWPIDRFMQATQYLIKNSKHDIVLLGSNKEHSMNEAIADLSDRVINLCGKVSLRETTAILKKAEFSLCNDSGLAHVSSAVGTKTIVLFGPHSPKHSRPLGEGEVFAIYKKFSSPYAKRGSQQGLKRIETISVTDVTKEIDSLL